MGQRFELPPVNRIAEKLEELKRNIMESRNLTETSRRQLRNYLVQINQIGNEQDVSALEVYKWFVAKEKAIYATINHMRQGKATYIGYLWLPTMQEDTIRNALRTYPTTDFQRYENHSIKPPTYIKSNEFTGAFQEIVDTYGIPMHKEINPAVFAIVTFPFLFGVMFGDVGHGFLLFFVGALLCLMEGKLRGGPAEGVLFMRYLLLLMGFFAMFNGLVYNEFFAIPMQVFGESCYSTEQQVMAVTHNVTDDRWEPSAYGYSRTATDCVYPFGFDFRWYISDQLLSYTNNFKMKLAVIFAIIQMSLGIVLKGLNALHFKDRLGFFFEFIPQLVLLLVLFGWMDVLIFAKWMQPKNIDANYVENTAEFNMTHYSPAIITTMIDIFLNGASNVKGGKVEYRYVFFADADGNGGPQATVSLIFVIIALICTPTMLLVKPLVLKKEL